MKILAIEDDTKFAGNLKKALEIEGYEVDVVEDGEQGLHDGLRPIYDLIILDYMLPKRDGISVVQELRSRSVRTPVIMLTARGETHDKIAGLDSGADDYLVKPFGFDELFARVRSHIRRTNQDISVPLEIGGLRLDPMTREVHRDSVFIDLSPKEYTLLAHLMKNQHRVVSRDELIGLLWKEPPMDNVLDVHIHYLRRKIDGAHEKKLVHTIKSVGYRIAA